MATISFANLDQGFNYSDSTIIAYGSYEGYTYSYFSTGGDNLDFFGVGLTDNGSVLTGGTVNTINIDLDGDNFVSPELVISGLSVAATGFLTNLGTANEQRDNFWAAALAGDDVISFSMAAPQFAFFAGDGVSILDGALHFAGDDSFPDNGGFALASTSQIYGDYGPVASGSAIGGDDTMTMGAFLLNGDFLQVSSGATGVGGDDVMAPARLDANLGAAFLAEGDANFVSGALFAGNDFIDLRSTDLTGYAFSVLRSYGDAAQVLSFGVMIGAPTPYTGRRSRMRYMATTT
jgi:hypothetical protein